MQSTRRDFLKVSATLAAVANTGTLSAAELPNAEASTRSTLNYSAEEHRRRLHNISRCEHGIRACMRKYLITDYRPAQCVYNLGEYPCRKPWDPDDYDEQELDRLRDHGIQIVQLHEEWNDPLRLFGGNKFSPLNPAGFKRFVEMVHKRGMRVIVYFSSGFFDRRDPDFRAEWARNQDLNEMYYRYARCSPASPGWRAYLLTNLVRVLDEYGVDGIYNDLGYVPLSGNPQPPTPDEVLAFDESSTHDGALEDLLGLMYAEVKRRGGVVKVHYSATNVPLVNTKVFDYLWVGESVQNGDAFREAVKNIAPYVVPCLDMSRATIASEDELYLHALPYMQFPLLLAGRPFTGERGAIPGIEYPPEEQCFWTRHCRAIWKRYQEHPEGPFSYGWWDSVPGRPEARPTHAKWLRQYQPMVDEGTRAYLEIGESDFFAAPLPKDVVSSAYANRALYLVLANYGQGTVDVKTAFACKRVDDDAALASDTWQLPARTMTVVRAI